MSTVSRSRNGKQPQLFRIHFIVEGVTYAVIPLKADPGVASKAYRFRKLEAGGETYDVHVNGHGPECECLGFLRWRKPCRHIRTLVAAGMLPAELLQPSQPANGKAPQV